MFIAEAIIVVDVQRTQNKMNISGADFMDQKRRSPQTARMVYRREPVKSGVPPGTIRSIGSNSYLSSTAGFAQEWFGDKGHRQVKDFCGWGKRSLLDI